MQDPLTAFYLDRAVALFSLELQHELDDINNNPKKSAGQKRMATRMLLARRLQQPVQFR